MSEAVDDVNDEQSSDDARVDAGWRSAIAESIGEVEASAPAESAAPEPEPAREPAETPEVETEETRSTEVPAPLRAPQSWKASAKEAFAKAPPEVQAEVVRRERDIQTAMQAAAEERKFGGGFREAIAPFESLIQQAGISAPQAVSGLLQREHALLTGPRELRAQMLARGIREYLGTDEAALTLLAQHLNGEQGGAMPQAPPAPPAPPTPSREQIDAYVQQQVQARYAQANEAEALQAIQQFGATRPEHMDTVLPEMAAFLQAEESRGRTRFGVDDIRKAYDAAVWANPQTRAIEKRKEEAKAAVATNTATKKAKAAAVSVKSTPVGPAGPPPLGDDTRSHVAAAWEAAERRQ